MKEFWYKVSVQVHLNTTQVRLLSPQDINSFYYKLVFRANEVVEHQIYGFLGYQETIYGKYKMLDDIIIFLQKPYDNDFLSDTLLIDIEKKVIFTKNLNDEFPYEKEWLNHYKIDYLRD